MIKDKLILLGKIGSPKGLRGDFALHSVAASVAELKPNIKCKIGFSENFARDFTLEVFTVFRDKKVTAKLRGVDTKEDAEKFSEQGLFVYQKDILEMNPGFYSIADILGCQVKVKTDGTILGEITEVWELPANDVWLVDTENGELPLPVIDDVVLDCDIDNKIVTINLMDGLLDLLNKTQDADDKD